jgi:FlaA1/EpsC-like NDP-sugar epimerase
LDQESAGWMCAIISVQLGALIWRRQCRGLLSYFSLPELKQLVAALGVACLLSLGLWTLASPSWLPRNLILVDALLSLCALGGFRLLLRLWREHASSAEEASENPPLRVGIIGAGDVGIELARELTVAKQFGRTVLAFFDDDFRKWRRCIHDIPVIGMPECLLDGWADKLDEVIIAIPKGAAKRIREISQLLQKAGLRVYTAPSPRHLWSNSGDRFSSNLKL